MVGYLDPNKGARHMSWLLPIMALDIVDEAVVNAKVICVLPVYSNTITILSLLITASILI